MPVRSSAPTKQPQKSLNRSRSNSPKLRRSRSSEDVQAATSLPPSVEGPLRCFLQVEVSKLILLTPTVVDKPTVRLKWWGEKQESRGTVFRPKVFRNKTEIAATDSNGKSSLKCNRSVCILSSIFVCQFEQCFYSSFFV